MKTIPKKQPSVKESVPKRVQFSSICIPQPNGAVLVKPGKATVMGEEIRVREFAAKTGLSQSRVCALCNEGKISSRRLTPNKNSPHVIPLNELDRYLSINKIESPQK